MSNPREGLPVPERLRRLLWAAVILGLLVFVAGLLFAPQGVWPSFLVAVLYLLGLGLSGPLFLSIHDLCGGRWAGPLRGLAEVMGGVIAPAAGLMALLVFGAPILYEWTHAEAVAASELLAHKSVWLDLPFFLARGAAVLVLWVWLARRVVAASRGAREAGLARPRSLRTQAAFVVGFGLGMPVAVFDWIMSLEPEWYSTLFPVYIFSGMFLSGLAAIALLAVLLGRGSPAGVDVEVRHDLGRLLFAFAFFWGYIWFSQYMLIWYTNIPEEAAWFVRRQEGGWGTMSWVAFTLCFVVPFVALMSRSAKRSATVLARVAVAVLVGHWVDLYVMVTPPLFREPPIGLWEVGPTVGVLGLFGLVLHRRLHASGRPPPPRPPEGAPPDQRPLRPTRLVERFDV